MFRGGWATDLFSAAAARYVTVLPVMAVPSQDVPALEVCEQQQLIMCCGYARVQVSGTNDVRSATVCCW